MTHEEAVTLWTALVDEKMPAALSYRHHEKMTPADAYQVTVHPGPGRFGADRLQRVMAIAEEHGVDAHLIGDTLMLLPGPSIKPYPFNR